jgi:uncharacterized protein YebE (UPF0316 family)
MFSEPFFSSEVIYLVVIPFLIFLARILDVTVGTLRIIFVARGRKHLAAFLGFIEAIVWTLAISQVIQNLNNWATYVAFALGFSAGNYIGVLLEEKLAMGNLIIRIITRQEADELVHFLWNSGYGVTSVDGWGETGPVKVNFTVCKRRYAEKIIKIIKHFNPKAFYTIEDVRFVQETFVPPFHKERFPIRIRK